MDHSRNTDMKINHIATQLVSAIKSYSLLIELDESLNQIILQLDGSICYVEKNDRKEKIVRIQKLQASIDKVIPNDKSPKYNIYDEFEKLKKDNDDLKKDNDSLKKDYDDLKMVLESMNQENVFVDFMK